MLKVKIKYINPARLVRVGKFGKKYATVAATTLVDVDPWLKEVGATTLVDVDRWLKAVGAVTMGYKAGGAKDFAPIAFLSPAKLRSNVSIRFYNADGKCVAKWGV